MMQTNLGRRVSGEIEWWGCLVIAACVLIGILAGCGSPASDPTSGLDSRAATGKPANVSATGSAELGAQGTRQVSDARMSGRGDRSGQNDRASASQPAIADKSDETTEERNAVMSPDIPEAIAEDLGSPDARIRYRALDYWETQQDQPPLTPVFEAMEDEDPAVRAKAATIVERHMDLEKEQEGS
jgi:hypothetical protein